MVAGHLRLRNGYWHMILSYNNEMGKRITKSVTTHLKEKGNKKRAEEMLLELRRQATAEQQLRQQARGIYFDVYLKAWLKQIQFTVSPTTFRAYSTVICGSISPYFKPLNILISELKPKHIAEYYNFLLARGLSPTTVRRHHANIHKALKCAVVEGLIQRNPADCVEIPKQAKYAATYYSAEECRKLLAAVKGSELELPVALTLCLGLRRCEVLGLKWEAVDFAEHVIHIRHAVHQVQGQLVERDTLKRKSSCRTLPLSAIQFLLSLMIKKTGGQRSYVALPLFVFRCLQQILVFPRAVDNAHYNNHSLFIADKMEYDVIVHNQLPIALCRKISVPNFRAGIRKDL